MEIARKIKAIYDPHCEMPLSDWIKFTDVGEVVVSDKGEVVKRSGAVEKNLHFILQGSGGLLVPRKSSFVCINLSYENEFFGDYMSFLTGQPTPTVVTVFERTEMFRISKSMFDLVVASNSLAEKICRVAAQSLFIHRQQQQIDLLIKTATERYKELLLRQPHVLQRTPQKYIASYLGITPQSLSRIRNSLSRI